MAGIKNTRRTALKIPVVPTQTFVRDDSAKNLPTDLDRTKQQVLPEGAATPGGEGRDIGKYESNTPDNDIDERPRTLGVPGEEYGVPYKNDYGTVTRRTMTSDEEEAVEKEGAYKQRWKPGQRQHKQRGRSKQKSRQYYKKNRSKILSKQRRKRKSPAYKNNPARKRSEKRRRKQNRRRVGTLNQPCAACLAERFAADFAPVRERGGKDGLPQRRQPSQERREDAREYRGNRSQQKADAKRYYHRKCKNNPRCQARREEYRENPDYYERRSPKQGSVLTVPDIAFVIGKNQVLGYVNSISPMTGMVTFQLDGSNVSQLGSLPVEVFLRAVTLLSDEDITAFFELVDVEIGLEAYEDLDEEGLRECAGLYDLDPSDEGFKDQCFDLVGEADIASMSADQLDVVNDTLVMGLLEGGGGTRTQDTADDEDETISDEYDPHLFYGEVEFQKVSFQRVAGRFIRGGKGDVCDSSNIAYCWISPKGEVHLLSGSNHNKWAEANFDKYMTGERPEKRWEFSEVFARAGWIQVTNLFALLIQDPPRAAWRAYLNLALECAQTMPEKDLRRIESDRVYIENLSSGGSKVTLADLLAQKLGQRAQDAVFQVLLDRTEESRFAAESRQADMTHAASVALMKWLSRETKSLGIAKHVYVVGGAVRNFVLEQPIKDIDMVVDSLSLGGRNAEWLAKQISQKIPAATDIITSSLLVSTVQIRGSWILDGHEMEGEAIDIADARKEIYDQDAAGNSLGHKPNSVEPTTMETDVSRREFTFNTLLWRLMDLAEGPDKAEIIDLTGCGLRDLQNREMRCPGDPDDIFDQDPTRILRTIKFAFKYGMKLPPDVKAAAKRQAKGLKRIPSKAWTVLQTIALDNPQYKAALDAMADLGVTEVLAEMMEENKQFGSTLGGYAHKRGLAYMFDLMDKGIPVGAPMRFLDGAQQKILRQITTPMDRDEALEFLEILRNPGRVYSKAFIPALAASQGVEGRQMAQFMPGVTAIGREALLDNPSLAHNPTALMRLVEQKVTSR